ncbi:MULTISPECIES: hypothetical protein [unclassified Sporosarcina]|uniref:hypothetical protein n=1 Tax=unclassified Sporosarcina TaxID=2647733 RepID=UPI001614818B|nr:MULTISPECIES: hypothetical protein [unclassified Sporosarcina]MBB4826620.1 hypothetical protein [Sporosarcina luteola]QTD40346.1 hypothetical protein J3U78_16385 [Sporosarcina sp. Te-1]GKV56293.1 hypothetical protein NCCP2222_22400 [Sporosarcina sp. NCCP-2222]
MNRKRVFTEHDRKDAEGPYMDNPENMKTDKESIYDMHEDMQTVDTVPLEDAKMEWNEEKQENHHKTKSDSSTEEKFPG